MQKDRIISIDDLMILINELYLSNKRSIRVGFPFYDLDLFTIDVGRYELRSIVNQDSFMRARDKNMPDSDFLLGDLPRYSDFRDCLITSTFLPFSNFEDVSNKLIAFARTIKSPLGRAKPLYLAVDTNLLYLKFFTRYFPLTDDGGERITAIDFRIALSDLVREEVDINIKYKYRASNLTKMKKAFGHGRIVDEFFNCSSRKTRIAKSAQNEIKHLFAELEAERADAGEYSQDKEERDRFIAKSYSNFEKERGGEVLLFTADEDMAYHAKNAGLLSETLVIPHEVPRSGRIKPCNFVNLLYDLALTFGVIKLGGAGVLIFGEWRGKGIDEYSREHVKILIEAGSKIREEFERDLRITKSIDDLT